MRSRNVDDLPVRSVIEKPEIALTQCRRVTRDSAAYKYGTSERRIDVPLDVANYERSC